jgi:DNA-3-methyladenine glycosylase
VRDPADGLGRRTGRIVEVEAYIGSEDRASHARFGPTARNAPMFGRPGGAYVYLVYGMHRCLNVVTEPAGRPAALLVRAVAPIEGLDAMRAARLSSEARRGRGLDHLATERLRERLDAVPDLRLASGPGLVCGAFGIEVAMSGLDLLDPESPLRLEIAATGEAVRRIVATPRIGVAYAGQPWSGLPWRFAFEGDPSVSGSGGGTGRIATGRRTGARMSVRPSGHHRGDGTAARRT